MWIFISFFFSKRWSFIKEEFMHIILIQSFNILKNFDHLTWNCDLFARGGCGPIWGGDQNRFWRVWAHFFHAQLNGYFIFIMFRNTFIRRRAQYVRVNNMLRYTGPNRNNSSFRPHNRNWFRGPILRKDFVVSSSFIGVWNHCQQQKLNKDSI